MRWKTSDRDRDSRSGRRGADCRAPSRRPQDSAAHTGSRSSRVERGQAVLAAGAVVLKQAEVLNAATRAECRRLLADAQGLHQIVNAHMSHPQIRRIIKKERMTGRQRGTPADNGSSSSTRSDRVLGGDRGPVGNPALQRHRHRHRADRAHPQRQQRPSSQAAESAGLPCPPARCRTGASSTPIASSNSNANSPPVSLRSSPAPRANGSRSKLATILSNTGGEFALESLDAMGYWTRQSRSVPGQPGEPVLSAAWLLGRCCR